ncbi:DnaJ domain-containing protein [Alphaproteobacteria bacterium GH1-50]|uniref:DnaJ domain-containing protein n=1 Tax=Kangsaoukella pontilimi TaxID=2691042 RepID=A0A7C9IQQ2_9RHOB|nr:J domain-containing protein [Kangsaoukella pontilimi]MXQ06546.1 DnaJ domain-containing protein [Kangsaoukella pontilimi]
MSPIERVRQRSKARSILGLDGAPSLEEIRKAYRRKAFDIHPDRGHGSSDDLAELNAAYALLTGDMPEAANAAPEERKVSARRPTRPELGIRVLAVDEMTMKRAERLLAETREDASAEHVAVNIRQTGRRLTYLFSSRLSQGRNRIALPAEILASPVRNTPRIITFRSANAGRGQVRLPRDLVTANFPGATEVVLQFGVAVN